MTRLEFSDAKSNKFWEVQVNGADLETRWGRIGANGQTKTKTFASADAAAAAMSKQITAKKRKGYVEATASPVNAAAPITTPETVTHAAPVAPAAAHAVPTPVPSAPTAQSAPTPVPSAPAVQPPAAEPQPTSIQHRAPRHNLPPEGPTPPPAPLPYLPESELIAGYLAECEQHDLLSWRSDLPVHAAIGKLKGGQKGSAFAAFWTRQIDPQTASGSVNHLSRVTARLADGGRLTFTDDSALVIAHLIERRPDLPQLWRILPLLSKYTSDSDVVQQAFRRTSRALRSAGQIEVADTLNAKQTRVAPLNGIDRDAGVGLVDISWRKRGLQRHIPSLQSAWNSWRRVNLSAWERSHPVVIAGLALTSAPTPPQSLTPLLCQGLVVLGPEFGANIVAHVQGAIALLDALADLEGRLNLHQVSVSPQRMGVTVPNSGTATLNWRAAWDVLADHIARLDDASYDGFVRHAHSLMGQKAPGVDVGIAGILRDPDLCTASLRHPLRNYGAALQWIAPWAGDSVEDCLDQLRSCGSTVALGAPLASIWLHRFGASCIPVFERWTAEWQTADTGRNALSSIVSVEAGEALLRTCKKPKLLKQFVTPFLHRWPEIALVVLAKQKVLTPVHHGMLRQLVREDPDRARALLHGTAWARAEAQLDDRRTAEDHEVPRILVERPWSRKLPKAPKLSKALLDVPVVYSPLALDPPPSTQDPVGQRYAVPASISQLLRVPRETALDWARDDDLNLWNEINEHRIVRLAQHLGSHGLDVWLGAVGSAPEMASHALVRFNSPTGGIALARYKRIDEQRVRGWMARYPQRAALGWIVGLATEAATVRARCAVWLWRLYQSHAEVVVQTAEDLGCAPWVTAFVESMVDGVPPAKAKKVPAEFAIEGLIPPRLASRDAVLPEHAVRALVECLASTPVELTPVGLASIREACEPESLAEFAWSLFQVWLLNEAPSAHRWCLDALGHLGNDAIVDRLVPLICAWPGESQHQRAVRALTALERVGTDHALSQLHSIGQRVKFKALKTAASDRIQDIAHARGMTSDELADRLVPDLGLDSNGSRVLEFGPRQFTVGFDEHLVPFVMDAGGKRRKSLPRANAKDDAILTEQATATWKTMRTLAKRAAKEQLRRMERAMTTRRRWSAADFQRFFVQHPLMVHLTRRLVWGVFDGQTVLQTFRVSEDLSLADVDDEPFTLGADATVGIPHVLELDADALTAWAEVLTDYELIQPFDQLHRTTYALQPGETTQLERFTDVEFPWTRLMALPNRGWQRGDVMDAGVIYDWSYRLGPVTVQLDVSQGINVAHSGDNEPQSLYKVATRKGGDLTQAHPIELSELLRDLYWLTGTA